MSVQIASALLAQLAALAFVAGGLVLMVGGFGRARAWVGRLLLLGVVLTVFAAMVTPEWLP